MADSTEKVNKVRKPRQIIKNAVDMQRLRLEKLMEKPDKPVHIPEPRNEKSFPNAPEFNRNVMGSSAGAGSGEFHVYRHLRRKEYSRLKHIQGKGEMEKKDDEFQQKLEENERKANEKTAKKRAKRLKKKAKQQAKKAKPDTTTSDKIAEKTEDSDEDTDESNDN